jgi:hypothetical protein
MLVTIKAGITLPTGSSKKPVGKKHADAADMRRIGLWFAASCTIHD